MVEFAAGNAAPLSDLSMLQLDEFRQRKACLFDAAEETDGRTFLHEHDVVLTAKELRQVREVARELGLMFYRRELFSLGDVGFGEWIENEHAGRAAFGLRMDVQFVD